MMLLELSLCCDVLVENGGGESGGRDEDDVC